MTKTDTETPTQAPVAFAGRNPDVLTCIANLSNDEVFTPPELANQMLDTLAEAWSASHDGASIWENSTVTFLDPFTKSGVFLREITKRLVDGLASEIPDLHDRVDHILTKQVYGIGITELTALLARRSLYCSKWADGEHSIAKSFDNPDGNIWFERTEHTWTGSACSYCRAGRSAFDRDDALETHAYAFIHTDDIMTRITELFGADMQFDVIIGNPPYQIAADDAGKNVVPIYDSFVRQAAALEPHLLTMVIPSRWMTGGRGLDEFRDWMLSCGHLSCLVDYPNSTELFPSVDIKSGVCYFLWESDEVDGCTVTTHRGAESVGPHDRQLDEFDVFVRDGRAVPILRRILKGSGSFLSDITSVRDPFGPNLGSNFSGYRPTKRSGDLRLVLNGSAGSSLWIEPSLVTRSADLINEWKVFLPKAGPGNSGGHVIPDVVIGKPLVGEPGAVCSATYLVFGPVMDRAAAESLASYLTTRFARFMVSLRKPSQNTTRDTYRWVPQQPWDRVWTDEELYAKYKLTKAEIAFIESMIRPMELADA